MEINTGDRVMVDRGKPFILGRRAASDEQPQRIHVDEEGQGDMLTAPGAGEPTGICINEPGPDIFKENTLKAINESLAEKFKTVRPLRAEGELTFWDKWLLAVYFARTAKPASN